MVFVSDRHKGIENALKVVYPNYYHGLCMYHISQNIKAKKFGQENQILSAFYLAAKKYLPSIFEYYMTELEIINIRVVEYLSEIEVERWARCKFSVTRYNIMTTNIVECMNEMQEKYHLCLYWKLYAQSYNNGFMIVEPLPVT